MPNLEFKGKSFIYTHHLGVPYRELTVVPKKSCPAPKKKPSLDDNLIIHGDNLEALKALLPRYAGKVDCIYIDPPYNTGTEGWCYNDAVNAPLMREWLKNSANPVDKEDLQRHDKWLCMMWPRLQLLKELLAHSGSIWVSLDDNECHRARCVLDEIFGEDNFLANVIWEKADSPRMDAEFFSSRHDHVLVYAKAMDLVSFHRIKTANGEPPEHYNKEDDSGRRYYLKPLRSMGGQGETRAARPNLHYPLVAPDGSQVIPKLKDGSDGTWRWGQDKVEREGERIEWKKMPAGFVPYFRIYADNSDGIPPETIFYNSEVGSSRTSKLEIKQLFQEGSPFDTPKPVGLIQRILEISSNKNSLILDSFAGSGTTAHAVLALNSKDGGNRRFILCEMEDYADKLTAERVRRVIKGYKYSGTAKTELMPPENVTWTTFNNEKRREQILERIAGIESLEGKGFDDVKKEIKNGKLTVTGIKTIEEKMPGLGGSFTYVELGEPMGLETLLSEKPGKLPRFAALARYLFHTATGQTLDTKADKLKASGAPVLIGGTEVMQIYLHYQPNEKWLRSPAAAFNRTQAEAIAKKNKKSGKQVLVFAAAKFVSHRTLRELRVNFAQLPYSLHRIQPE